MTVLSKDLQEKIVQAISTVKKKEDVDDQDDQDFSKGPVVPPVKMVSIETQTDFPEESEKLEALTKERNQHLSQQREATEEKKKDISADDTAPQKKPVTRECYGQDISGNETDSILSKLGDCFKDGYHGERAGFYNLGFPALSQS